MSDEARFVRVSVLEARVLEAGGIRIDHNRVIAPRASYDEFYVESWVPPLVEFLASRRLFDLKDAILFAAELQGRRALREAVILIVETGRPDALREFLRARAE